MTLYDPPDLRTDQNPWRNPGRSRPGIGGGLPEHVVQTELFAASRDGIEGAFWKFHEENRQIYLALVFFAREAKAAGRRRFGIKAVWERMRWQAEVETKSATKIKLNNNFPSRYARLIMKRERCSEKCLGCSDRRCLAEFFDTRELQTPTSL